jgi:hypothetical protein
MLANNVQDGDGRARIDESFGTVGRRRRVRNPLSTLELVSAGVAALAVGGVAMSVPAFAAAFTASPANFSIFNPPSQSGAPAGAAEALTDVYAASPTDIWAVGGATGDPFEHWNGTVWTGQGLPRGMCTVANNQCSVRFITGTSADNITAVGSALIDTDTSEVSESVAFHFNGTAWSNMKIPADVTLGPVKAFSAKNLWSVSGRDAEHFNGSTWVKTKLPITSTQPELNMTSISGSSPSDIWAAGTASNEGLHRNNSPLLEHFNGNTWTNVTVPVSSPTGGLTDVLAITPSDAYLVTTVGAILHWNGSAWMVLKASTQTGAAVTGSTLAALSPTDVWIGGFTMLDNFNGTSWTSEPVPSTAGLTPAGQDLNAPDAAAAVGAGSVWFVGNTFTATGELPYAMGTSEG